MEQLGADITEMRAPSRERKEHQMIRSLKTLGLALVAVLALSAVVASAASAAPKLTPSPEEYPVTLKGAQTGVNVLELDGTRPTECAVATFEGTIANKAEAEESKLTAQPKYEKCTTTILGNKDPATVTMNGCDYLLTATATTEGTIKTEGWEVTGKEIHIQCPVGKEIEVHVFASEAKDLASEPLCTYKVAAQTAGGDLDYRLTELGTTVTKDKEGHVIGEHTGYTSGDIKSTLTGIAVTRASGTLTNCGKEAQTGVLKGEVKVEGFNKEGVMLRGNWED